LVTAALLGAVCSAAAQTFPQANPLTTRPGWEVGGQGAKYRYEEPDFIKITGNRSGGVGAFTVTGSNRLFSRFDARLSYGSLKYEGSGTQENVPDTIFETRAVGGGYVVLGGNVSLSLYAGLGYRYLYNDLRGYTNDGTNTYVGYRRYSHYLYVPVGVTSRIHAGGRWVVASTIENDRFIRGKQESKLSDTELGYRDVTNTQKRGRGHRASVMVEKDHWAFGPWFHYWSIKDSDLQPSGMTNIFVFEPANWTREYGVELRYRF
jgi:hypothetical protein